MTLPHFDALGLVAQIITAFGVVLAMLQLIKLNQQQHREFEQLYVQRYWSIQDRFSPSFQLGKTGKRLGIEDRAAAHAYLQLCEDELDMYKALRFTQSTWRIWDEGMQASLRQEPFKSMLQVAPPWQWSSIQCYLREGTPTLQVSWLGTRWRGLN